MRIEPTASLSEVSRFFSIKVKSVNFKFCKKSSERFKQKNDVGLSFKRPLWLQRKEWDHEAVEAVVGRT